MSKSLNRVQLIGHLGKDPEIRRNQADTRIATFSLATSESWTDKATGARREYTQWHKVVILNDRLSGVADQYLRKGSRVMVEGQLEYRKWTDKDGKDHFFTEVMVRPLNGDLILLDSRNMANNDLPEPEHSPQTIEEIIDDEIPY